MTEDRTKMMTKIRSLFAKAKASEYEAEAEAFAGKAQDLLSRHSISRHELGGDPHSNEIVQKHIPIGKGPYVRARLALISAIGKPNGVLVMMHTGSINGTHAVLRGTAEAIESVELLHAHLDVFANRQMAKLVGEKDDGFFVKPPSTLTVRRSWLFGFAETVGERLAQANKKVDEDYGGTLLPALFDDITRAKEGLHLRKAGRAAGVDGDSFDRGKSAGYGADIGQARVRTGRAQLGAGA